MAKFFDDNETLYYMVEHYFPALLDDLTEFGWLWVKAQVWKESSYQIDATSPCGAQGLLQLMPATARELGCSDPFDPLKNLAAGITYLAKLYGDFSEIPNHRERLRFAFASYNGGKGYINRALQLARAAENLPSDFVQWQRTGSTPGWWQTWEAAKKQLRNHQCHVNGKTPDWKQIIDYVHHIEAKYSQLLADENIPRRHEAWSL